MQPPRRSARGRSSAAARSHLTLLIPNAAPMLEGVATSPVRRIEAPLVAADSPAARLAPPVAFRGGVAEGDLPHPAMEMSDLEAAIDALRHAAQSDSVAARGDAILEAMGRLTSSLADLFDREVARAFLAELHRNV